MTKRPNGNRNIWRLDRLDKWTDVSTDRKGCKSRANEYNTDINQTVTTIDRTNVEVKNCEDTKQDQLSWFSSMIRVSSVEINRKLGCSSYFQPACLYLENHFKNTYLCFTYYLKTSHTCNELKNIPFSGWHFCAQAISKLDDKKHPPGSMNLLGKMIFCPRYTRRLLITLDCKKCSKFCGISDVEAIFHLGHFLYTL